MSTSPEAPSGTGCTTTHTPTQCPPAVLDLVTELCARTAPPGIMLERDDAYPSHAELGDELDRIAAAAARGGACREHPVG